LLLDSYRSINALMESIIGLYKAECIDTDVFHPRPYKSLGDVEYATAGWVDWSTTADSTAPSATSRRSSSNKPTTLPSTPTCSQYDSGTKPGRLQAARPGNDEWSTSTRSNGPKTTTERSTR
jgi:hypothetical protein